MTTTTTETKYDTHPPLTEPWREVTKAEFFRVIGTMDVHPSIQPGRYPYTSIWQTPQRNAIGKSVGSMEGGRERTAWFLRKTAN